VTPVEGEGRGTSFRRGSGDWNFLKLFSLPPEKEGKLKWLKSKIKDENEDEKEGGWVSLKSTLAGGRYDSHPLGTVQLPCAGREEGNA